MRTLLDTCVIIDWATDPVSLSDGVWDILDDPENRLYISAETVRELVVSFNNKNLLPKYWKTSNEMFRCIEEEYGIEVLPITRDVMETYTHLVLNDAQGHKAPSDYVIISHAITGKLTLLSSDTHFSFYRNQGLDLVEY